MDSGFKGHVISSGKLETLIRKFAFPDVRNKGEVKPAWGAISELRLGALYCTKVAKLKTQRVVHYETNAIGNHLS